jgi:acyl phosphate:glycerol-3-phosphate acyltransferase
LSSAYFLLFRQDSFAAVALLLSALIYYMHRQNIRRLLRGEEPRIGSKSNPPG